MSLDRHYDAYVKQHNRETLIGAILIFVLVGVMVFGLGYAITSDSEVTSKCDSHGSRIYSNGSELEVIYDPKCEGKK